MIDWHDMGGQAAYATDGTRMLGVLWWDEVWLIVEAEAPGVQETLDAPHPSVSDYGMELPTERATEFLESRINEREAYDG